MTTTTTNKIIVESDIKLQYDTDGIKSVIDIKKVYDGQLTKKVTTCKLEKILYFKNIQYSLPMLGKTEYTPTKGDKFYIFPDCSVPRYKFKSLCDKEELSITRTRDKANIWVISDDTLEKLCWRRSRDVIKIGLFMEYSDKFKDLDDGAMLFIQERLNSNDVTVDDYILLDYEMCNLIEKTLPLGFDEDGDPKGLNTCTYFLPREEENEKIIEDLLTSTKLYHENSILKYINSAHGTVMTEDMYNTIKSLFESSDSQNHVVAMESMANCVYPDSACYLLMLLEEYGGIIYDNRTKNNINFRSMLKFFGLGTSSRLRNVDDILHCLKHSALFTSENLAFFYPKIMEELKDHGNNTYFEVDTIKLTEEGMKILNKFEPNGAINN